MTIRECLDALDDVEAPTVARARYETEKILLAYVSPRVTTAYIKAIERARVNQRAAADPLEGMEIEAGGAL
jgi:hypothetical protein